MLQKGQTLQGVAKYMFVDEVKLGTPRLRLRTGTEFCTQASRRSFFDMFAGSSMN